MQLQLNLTSTRYHQLKWAHSVLSVMRYSGDILLKKTSFFYKF